MTYYESAADMTVTKARAFKEFKAHGSNWEDFNAFLMDVIADPQTKLDDEGNIQEMSAQAVLAWLGY
jgi:hypothetical protein